MKRRKIRRPIQLLIAGVVLALFCVAGLWVYCAPPPDQPVFAKGHLTIVRADGQKFPFDIEIARAQHELEYGLMHRRHMAPDAGMLFLYQPPGEISMWMKDTILPLDMLFIRTDGTIAKIAAHAQPFDLTPIPSGEPVASVLEVNAGTADRLGFAVGDKVLYMTFSGQ